MVMVVIVVIMGHGVSGVRGLEFLGHRATTLDSNKLFVGTAHG